MSGSLSYHAGLAAEEQVAAHYAHAGAEVLARRWRGAAGGEIDMVARQDDLLIFIEVKHARSHAWAAERLSQRQLRRIWAGAELFRASKPEYSALDTRFDLALVDGQGRIEIIETAWQGF